MYMYTMHGNIVIICLCLSISNPLTLMSSVVMKVMMMMRFILMTYHPVTHLSLRMFFVIIIVILFIIIIVVGVSHPCMVMKTLQESLIVPTFNLSLRKEVSDIMFSISKRHFKFISFCNLHKYLILDFFILINHS